MLQCAGQNAPRYQILDLETAMRAYRQDIDGLRALAILPVLLFHANVPWLKNGYLGVDVFFVISGFLITGIILEEIATDRFSLVGFYERRFRRILPALTVVCLASSLAAYALLLPYDLVDFGKSLVATNIFGSNFYYYFTSGYFFSASELKPLLHTWSLSVEEQFYFFHPIAIFLAVKFARKVPLILLMILCTLVSLAAAVAIQALSPTAAFFMLPTRAWQLLAGACMATVMRSRVSGGRSSPAVSGPATSLGAAISLTAIATPMLTSYGDSQMGAFAAFPVVLGTCGLLFWGGKESIVCTLLQSRPLVHIGLLSYSLYLWHQPALAFLKHATHELATQNQKLAVLLVAYFLSLATYRFVETPFRKRSVCRTKKSIFQFSALSSLLLLSIGFSFWFGGGFESYYLSHRLDSRERKVYELIEFSQRNSIFTHLFDDGECVYASREFNQEFINRYLKCVKTHGPGVILVGDSHSMNLHNSVGPAYKGGFFASITRPGCRPHNEAKTCQYQAVAHFLESNGESVKTVVFHEAGGYLLKTPDGQFADASRFAREGGNKPDADSVEAVIKLLMRYSASARVIWAGPFLDARYNPRSIAELAANGFKVPPDAIADFHRLETYLERRLANSGVEFFPTVRIARFGPDALLSEGCVTYYDPSHLSACGEALLGSRISDRLLTMLEESSTRYVQTVQR